MDIPPGWTWRNAQPAEWPERRILGVADVVNFLHDGEPRAQLIVLECRHYCVNSYGIWSTPLPEDGTMRCWTCFARGEKYEVRVEGMPPEVRAEFVRIAGGTRGSSDAPPPASEPIGNARKR